MSWAFASRVRPLTEARGEEFLDARITAFDAAWPGLVLRLASHSWRFVLMSQLIALLVESQSNRLQRTTMVCPSHNRAEQIQPSSWRRSHGHLPHHHQIHPGRACRDSRLYQARGCLQVGCKKLGVKVTATYWTMGDYDGLIVLEAAGDQAATAALVQLGTLGNVRTSTARAFTAAEMDKLLSKRQAASS